MTSIDAHGNLHGATDGRFATKPRHGSAGSLDAAGAPADAISAVQTAFAKHFPQATTVGLYAEVGSEWSTSMAKLYDADGELLDELQIHFDGRRTPEVDDELMAAIERLEELDGVPDQRLADPLPGTTDTASIRLRPTECSEPDCDQSADDGRDGLCADCADELLCSCGERNDGGDGFDGLCGNCADAVEGERTCSECFSDLDAPSSDGLCEDCSTEAESKRCRRCQQTVDHLSAADICDDCTDELRQAQTTGSAR